MHQRQRRMQHEKLLLAYDTRSINNDLQFLTCSLPTIHEFRERLAEACGMNSIRAEISRERA